MPTPKELYEAHRVAVAEFDARPPPDAYVCFFWPSKHQWQAITAWEELHRSGVDAYIKTLAEVRTPEQFLGDTCNVLARYISLGVESPAIGSMVLALTDRTESKYVFVTCREAGEGSFCSIKPMDGVPSVAEARVWVDKQPEIRAAKLMVLMGLLK